MVMDDGRLISPSPPVGLSFCGSEFVLFCWPTTGVIWGAEEGRIVLRILFNSSPGFVLFCRLITGVILGRMVLMIFFNSSPGFVLFCRWITGVMLGIREGWMVVGRMVVRRLSNPSTIVGLSFCGSEFV